jgi:hypothetical protein
MFPEDAAGIDTLSRYRRGMPVTEFLVVAGHLS